MGRINRILMKRYINDFLDTVADGGSYEAFPEEIYEFLEKERNIKLDIEERRKFSLFLHYHYPFTIVQVEECSKMNGREVCIKKVKRKYLLYKG